MKTATNIYIFNLALADALVTSTLPFQSVNYLMGTWPFGDVLCKMVMSIDYYNMFTSIFTLTTMSIDRYVAVCHPVKALDFRTPRNAKIVNVCNWILSSAIGLPVMFMAATAVTRKHGCSIIPTLLRTTFTFTSKYCNCVHEAMMTNQKQLLAQHFIGRHLYFIQQSLMYSAEKVASSS